MPAAPRGDILDFIIDTTTEYLEQNHSANAGFPI
jgi:hypothetical protein